MSSICAAANAAGISMRWLESLLPRRTYAVPMRLNQRRGNATTSTAASRGAIAASSFPTPTTLESEASKRRTNTGTHFLNAMENLNDEAKFFVGCTNRRNHACYSHHGSHEPCNLASPRKTRKRERVPDRPLYGWPSELFSAARRRISCAAAAGEGKLRCR